jgi:hypothetical protein
MDPKSIDDLVAASQEKWIAKNKATNLLSDLTRYVAAAELFAKHKKTFEGGLDWCFNVMIGSDNTGNGTAKFVKLFEEDALNRVDVLVKGKVSPCFLQAGYYYDLREPQLNNGTDVQLVRFVWEQMELMYQSFYDKVENAFWSCPTYAADLSVIPAGIQYWIQRQSNVNAALHANGAFDGGNPSLPASGADATATACPRAGISTATYARWANWCAQYAAVTKGDLIKKMRFAVRDTDFKSPLHISEPKLGTGRAIYCNKATISEMEDILEAQNMNLGNDLASKDGKTIFKGNPVEYVPYLNADTEDPIYMIDWSTLCLGILAGWDKKVSAPEKVSGQHNTRRVFMDASMNFVCTNLRNQAVLSKASA